MASYGNIKRAVLELINQSTIHGESVPLSYNGQSDYVLKIPNLINQAVMKIRTTTKPERTTVALSEGTVRGDWTCYPLPANCRSIVTGGVWKVNGQHSERTNDYRLRGNQILLPTPKLQSDVPEAVVGWDVDVCDGGYFIEYTPYPSQLPGDPSDNFDLYETPEVVQAAEYYTAAMLVMMEDEFTYTNLMNEYEARLAAMRPPLTAEVHTVRSVYEA